MASISFGFGNLSSLDIMKPRMMSKMTKSKHLSRLRMIPNSIYFSKHFLSFGKWLSISLSNVKSSKNNMNPSKYSNNILLIMFSYIGGAFFKPKGITKSHTKAPQYVMNIILLRSYGVIQIWWYLKNPSKNEYLTNLSHTCSVTGNEYVFFFCGNIQFTNTTRIHGLSNHTTWLNNQIFTLKHTHLDWKFNY